MQTFIAIRRATGSADGSDAPARDRTPTTGQRIRTPREATPRQSRPERRWPWKRRGMQSNKSSHRPSLQKNIPLSGGYGRHGFRRRGNSGPGSSLLLQVYLAQRDLSFSSWGLGGVAWLASSAPSRSGKAKRTAKGPSFYPPRPMKGEASAYFKL